jgi:hypothetical protein
MLGGGAIGVAMLAATNGAPSGTFKPNEDAAHKKSESAREAQEDAGQRPTVP